MTDINQEDELKKLMIENLADTKILKEEMAKIHSYMRWRTIISIVWIIIVVAPAVLAAFYIPSIISNITSNQNLIQGLGEGLGL